MRASFEPVPAGEPTEERSERDRRDGGNEHRGDAVDQPLHRRLAGLRVLDHADDARERRVLPDRDRLDDEAADAVQRPRGDAIALALDDRHALAGDKRLVGLALAGDDRPVDGKALARLDDDAIACAHLLDPDLGFPAVALHDGALRPQAHERANGGGRAALGARLQPLAEHDEGDDGGGALEIKVPGGFGAPHEHHIGAEGISGRRAERDQQVHIAGIGAQRLPGALVEARSDDELHGRGERKLDPRVEMQMQAERRGDHRQEERGGERRRCDEQHELTPFRIRARGLAFLFLAAALGERGCPRVRSVTDPLDRLRELRWRHGGGTKHDVPRVRVRG